MAKVIIIPNQDERDQFCSNHLNRMEALYLILDQIRDDPEPRTIDCFLLALTAAINKRWPDRIYLNEKGISIPGLAPTVN